MAAAIFHSSGASVVLVSAGENGAGEILWDHQATSTKETIALAVKFFADLPKIKGDSCHFCVVLSEDTIRTPLRSLSAESLRAKNFWSKTMLKRSEWSMRGTKCCWRLLCEWRVIICGVKGLNLNVEGSGFSNLIEGITRAGN